METFSNRVWVENDSLFSSVSSRLSLQFWVQLSSMHTCFDELLGQLEIITGGVGPRFLFSQSKGKLFGHQCNVSYFSSDMNGNQIFYLTISLICLSRRKEWLVFLLSPLEEAFFGLEQRNISVSYWSQSTLSTIEHVYTPGRIFSFCAKWIFHCLMNVFFASICIFVAQMVWFECLHLE